MITRKTGPEGLRLIREGEGLRLSAYRDGGGVLTIGYGHTRSVKPGQRITRQDAEQLLASDVYEAEQTIARHFTAGVIDALPALAYDALVDFAFNLGDQAFVNRNKSRTGIARAISEKRFAEVPRQMLRWVFDNGVKVEGLVNRRRACVAVWERGFKGDA